MCVNVYFSKYFLRQSHNDMTQSLVDKDMAGYVRSIAFLCYKRYLPVYTYRYTFEYIYILRGAPHREYFSNIHLTNAQKIRMRITEKVRAGVLLRLTLTMPVAHQWPQVLVIMPPQCSLCVVLTKYHTHTHTNISNREYVEYLIVCI